MLLEKTEVNRSRPEPGEQVTKLTRSKRWPEVCTAGGQPIMTPQHRIRGHKDIKCTEGQSADGEHICKKSQQTRQGSKTKRRAPETTTDKIKQETTEYGDRNADLRQEHRGNQTPETTHNRDHDMFSAVLVLDHSIRGMYGGGDGFDSY